MKKNKMNKSRINIVGVLTVILAMIAVNPSARCAKSLISSSAGIGSASMAVVASDTVMSIPVVDANLVKDETGGMEEIEEHVAAVAFENIPATDLDLLTTSMRQEMMIYANNDSIYKCRNIYSGLSWIEEVTPNYMKIHLTDVSTLEIKNLPNPVKRDSEPYLIMTIYTISGESATADSTIKFYAMEYPEGDSVNMNELPAKKYFALPEPKLFYNESKIKENGLKIKTLMEEMPFHTVAYEISPVADVLTGRLTMDNYLTIEQRDQLAPYLIKEHQWQWDGKKFKLKK